ncbi:MAG: aminoacyl-tRNA hydrolase [Eubacteriales bacterium]|nr:aminoacyl-tRNA hydrolase [Eubacteriales bacterium]
MYVIVGLGNPGKKYEQTRHNIGFITVDQLAEKHGIKINRIKHKALVGEGLIAGEKVILVKPQTYMNLSGNSVREVISYYKIDIEHLVLVYDDIDLPAGKIRIRKNGSAGTHNGMRSVIFDLAEDGFPRVRIGIGGERRMELADYVTSGFRKEEKEVMEAGVLRAVAALECLVEKGIAVAMNEYNRKEETSAEEKVKENRDQNDR